MRIFIIDFLSEGGQVSNLCVAALTTPETVLLHNGLIAESVEAIDALDLSVSERRAVNRILTREEAETSPFTRPEWIGEAQAWIRSMVPESRVTFTDDIRQFNAGARFALVRFGTSEEPAFWLKAVGPPNEHEFSITELLSKRFPTYLPYLVGMRAHWNAWVTREAGAPIRHCFNLDSLECAFSTLAELQVQSTSCLDHLLKAGCFDQRLSRLKDHIEEIIVFLDEAMADQISTRAPRLSSSRLAEIGTSLGEACRAMETLRIPDALIHNDLNLSNVLFDGSRCVFIDWAEAYVGNPFLTFQQLYKQAVRGPTGQSWAMNLKTKYGQRWLDFLSPRQIDDAMTLSRPLAIASYLYGRGEWLTSSRRVDPEFRAYARSLARHMDRAVQAPELKEVLCR